MVENISICPLCRSDEFSVIDEINPAELNKKYLAMTGVDFSYLLNKSIVFKLCNCCGLKYFDHRIAGDEAFYKTLQKFDWYYVDDKEEYLVAKEYVREGDLVLDVGCGKGAFAKHVFGKQGRFLGLDFSENAKHMAAKEGVEIKNESIQNFATSNPESVDLVTSFQVCEHVSDVKGFVEAKLSALKPGGKLIIAVPSEDSFLSKVTNGILNMPPHHITRWSDDVFRYIANQYNLELERVYHEKLQKVHTRWYLSTLIQNSILKPKMIDSSITRKFIGKMAAILSRFFEKGLTDEMKPNGHTVLAVFRKKLE